MDRNKIFPNQLVDGDLYECVALTVADLTGNILGFPVNPDFTYAATLSLEGVTPGVDPQGSDPWTALQSAVGYGVLPQSLAAFTAKTKGELYASDFRDYGPTQRQVAVQHQMVAPINLGVDYDRMITWMRKIGQGVMIPLTWFSEFGVAPNGIIPPPAGQTSNHCVAAYLDTDNTTVLIKPWLGSTWGRGGYGTLTRELYNTIAKDTFAFNPNGSHWWAIVAILLTQFPFLKDKMASFALLDQGVDITHTDILYPSWTPAFPNAHHNTRVICDLEGLTLEQKNILTACVMIESGFRIDAVNNNYLYHYDGAKYIASTDAGICQWNNIYHGSEITQDQAFHNPEMAVRLMCKYWKAGLMRQWVSYSSGAYLKWLGKV